MNMIPTTDAGSLRQASIGALLFDMDGVIYRGNAAIPGAAALIANLQAHQIPFLFLTNNATLTAAQFQAKLAILGIYVDQAAVFTSSMATAAWLSRQAPPGAPVLVVGEAGLRQPVLAAGLTVVTDWRQAAWVAVGLDREATWSSLRDAALAIRAGARFVATNSDATLPSEEGELPGAGALVAFLRTATGVEPTVVGKPQVAMFEQALARLGIIPAQAIMVGDRVETDIVGGQAAGLRTIGVLSGVSSAAAFAQAVPPPTWVFDSVAEINLALFE